MDDNEIVRRLQGSNRQERNEAIEAVSKSCGNLVYKIAIKEFSFSREEAEDLLQDILVIFLTNVQKKRVELHVKLCTYLGKVARNQCNNRSRGRIYHISLDHPDYNNEVEAKTEYDDGKEIKLTTIEGVMEFFEENNNKCYGLLKQFYLEKKKQKVIAKELGEKENTIRQQIRRCREKMKELLNRENLIKKS